MVMWVLGPCGTAQWLPCMCPTVPCAPALPGMGQGQLQQLLLASHQWGLGHRIAKRHQELFDLDAMGSPQGPSWEKGSKRKLRQAPTHFFHSWLFLQAMSLLHGIHSTPATEGPWAWGAMWDVPRAQHHKQPWGAVGCDPPPVVLGS